MAPMIYVCRLTNVIILLNAVLATSRSLAIYRRLLRDTAVVSFSIYQEFIERRRAALERFLNRTAAHPVLRMDPDFRDFLETDELPRATETSTFRCRSEEVITVINDSIHFVRHSLYSNLCLLLPPISQWCLYWQISFQLGRQGEQNCLQSGRSRRLVRGKGHDDRKPRYGLLSVFEFMVFRCVLASL